MDYSTSTSNGQVSFTVKGGFASVAWGFAVNYVDCTISATGQSDTKVTNQAVNIPSQTTATRQLVSKTFNVKREKSAKTVTLKVVTYNHSGYMNGTSTVSVNVTVPAATHTVIKYDANGGTGAPANQDKYYGYQLNLSSQRPTRPGYEFLSWNTAANGSGASWAPGANYTPDPGGTVTLYAQWKRSYIAPTLSGLTLQRTNESGAAVEEGTYAKVTGSWKVDTTLNSANKATNLKIEYQKSGDSAWTTAVSTNPNAASGSLSNVVGEGELSIESSYNFRVTVSDSGGSTTASGVLSASYFIMDVLEGGKGVSFGKACTQTGFYVESNDRLQIAGPGRGTTWIKGRDAANLRQNTKEANVYCPALSVKTNNGSWEFGAYQNENLYLSYCTDENYNSNTNTPGTQFIFGSNGAMDSAQSIVPVKLLWSGTLSKGGSVTIPDLPKWRAFVVATSYHGARRVWGVRAPGSGAITVFGAYDDGSETPLLNALLMVSETTLWLTGASVRKITYTGHTSAAVNITEIYGVF